MHLEVLILCTLIFGTNALIKPVKSYGNCLENKVGPKWERRLDFNNRALPITIEVTDRASHLIVSHVLAILLRERLRFSDIQFNYQPWDKPADALDRLSCPDNGCEVSPNSTINLEVWMPPGFNVESWVNRGMTLDCGPLGPTTRRGFFMKQALVDQVHTKNLVNLDNWRILDAVKVRHFVAPPAWFFEGEVQHWKKMMDCAPVNGSDCVILLVDQEEFVEELRNLTRELFATPQFSVWLGNQTRLEAVVKKLNRLSPDQAHLLFVNWYPNTVTVQGNFTRMSFPDCYGGGGIRAGLGNRSSVCDLEVNQLTKVVWKRVHTHARQAYDLVDQMHFSQEEYAMLLKQVEIGLEEEEERDKNYYNIACSWIKGNAHRWKKWTVDWDKKDPLVIGGMFAIYGKWNGSGLEKIARSTIADMNADLFKDSQYSLVLDFRNLTCAQDIVLKDYFEQTSSCAPNLPLIGIIAILCSDSIEPMVRLSNRQGRIVVSPTVESDRYLDKKQYKFFFRTVPSMNMYSYLLVEACVLWKWQRIVALRKDDHFVNPQVFREAHIAVDDFELEENQLTYQKAFEKVSQIKKKNGRIFVVEYFAPGTQYFLCAAWNLNMTLKHGYVWFVNPWLGRHWWRHPIENCTVAEMNEMAAGHLTITHRLDQESGQLPMGLELFYHPYTADAVKVLGHGVWQLLRAHPSALSALLDPRVAEDYRSIIANLSLAMISGKGDDANATDGGSLVFNQGNGRTTSKWAVNQYQKDVYRPIFMWDVNAEQRRTLRMNPAFDVDWMSGRPPENPPSDGTKESKPECLVEPIRRFLGPRVSCAGALVFINVLPGILLLLVPMSIFCCYYRKKLREAKNSEKKPYDELCAELADMDMPSSNIVLNRRVGQGAFGLVYGGEAKRKNRWEAVAVKVLNNNTHYEDKIQFLSEAKLMRELRHPNVVQLMGICLHPPENVIYLVMEFMLFGDLKTYLLSRRVVAAQNPNHDDICPTTLTNFAIDIARGIEYMHSLNLAHRDIACRNCLVGTDRTVKIGDFGLTRRMQTSKGDPYYRFTRNCELPIRWMSPEAVQFGVFSMQSDIWSYGVVLYEIITFGVFPYDGLCDVEVVERVKRREFSIAEFLPPAARNTTVWHLILHCCQYQPEDRPKSMDAVLTVLTSSPDSLMPCLTEEPPKPVNVTLNTLPFQPGVSEPPGRVLTSGGSVRLRASLKGRNTEPQQEPDLVLVTPDKGSRLHPSNPMHKSQSTEYISLQNISDDPTSSASAPGFVHTSGSNLSSGNSATGARLNGHLARNTDERISLLPYANRV